MKTAKRIIFISLLILLLAGTVLLDPLIRFTLDLHQERFLDAESIYLDHLIASSTLRNESAEKLKRYLEKQLARYFAKKLRYDRIMGILSNLSETCLPQQDVERCRKAAEEMEQARIDLAQADSFYQNGEYGSAIPFYRRSLIADESASFRLEQAEALYQNSVLDMAEAAMASGRYEDAEAALSASIEILDHDDDLLAAVEDVRMLKAGQTYHAWAEEARRLLHADGPKSAFAYLADLQQKNTDSYELEYLDQVIRHEYEADICEHALSLREGGDSDSACSLLQDALSWIDSDTIKSLLAETRASMTFWLVDMPILRDDTASARSGVLSTISRDKALTDVQGNEYVHSFWADAGSIAFRLDEDYKLFAGTVAFPQGETSDLYRASATLQIFGDGSLLAEFKNMDMTSSPLPFSLSISGIRELTLTWTSEGAGGWKDWGRFATVFDGRFLTTVPEQN